MQVEKKSGSRRRLWILTAFFALLLAPFLFIFNAKALPENPGVTARLAGFTNGPLGKVALFVFTNSSPLSVRIESYLVPGAEHYRLHEIAGGRSAAVGVELPSAQHVGPKEPFEIRFKLRRQDTSFENFREGLDSVFGSIGVRLPGLNPDSSLSYFEIRTTITQP